MLKRKTFALSLLFVSSIALAGNPYKASDTVMSTFENLPSSAWQVATSGSLGNVYILKSDVRATNVPWDPSLVHEKLGYLFPSNTAPGKRNILNVNYERVDEPGAGARNQCVALAKAMTSAPATKEWVKGVALTSLYPNQRAPSALEAMAKLPPGTMIANFDGSVDYPNRYTSHVVIVKGVNADSTGKVLSVDVYSQNGMEKVTLNGQSVAIGDNATGNGGTIMSYSIPWSSNSTFKSLSIKNYHVVNSKGYQKIHKPLI